MHLRHFSIPKIPGLENPNPGIWGLKKGWDPGIRDPGIGMPNLEMAFVLLIVPSTLDLLQNI
jgi:hypothetical protein